MQRFLKGAGIKPGDAEAARRWIDSQIEHDFPKAENLIKNMEVRHQFYDLTFETLNEKEFHEAIKKAYPNMKEIWEKAYEEFTAVREKNKST